MLNQKGQAFDAFKLLIAAVVAGSILVILLQIIGGITIATQKPARVMSQEMSTVKSGGMCSTSSSVVKFSEGTMLTANAVAEEAGMNPGTVEFCCSSTTDTQGCTDEYAFGDGFDCSSGSLTVEKALNGNVRACCLGGGNCTIGFQLPER